jgi:hypothetical protein
MERKGGAAWVRGAYWIPRQFKLNLIGAPSPLNCQVSQVPLTTNALSLSRPLLVPTRLQESSSQFPSSVLLAVCHFFHSLSSLPSSSIPFPQLSLLCCFSLISPSCRLSTRYVNLPFLNQGFEQTLHIHSLKFPSPIAACCRMKAAACNPLA